MDGSGDRRFLGFVIRRDSAMESEYHNILVINLMHIGDLMLVTPILRTLRSNYPAAHITLLADKKLRDLVEHNQSLDDCLLLDKKGKDNHIIPFLRFIGRIRARHFDLVINLHRNERASALAAFSGAKRIVGYAKPGFSLFFTEVLPNKKAVEHQIESHFEVLEKTGIIDHRDDGGLEMVLPQAAETSAARLWQKAFTPEQKVVALNIGASWKTKRWLDSYFAETADRLLERGYGIAFFGGPMDTGAGGGLHRCRCGTANPALHVFTGKVSLGPAGGDAEALRAVHHDGFRADACRGGDECPDRYDVRFFAGAGFLSL
jgi:heptosyltransferase-2